MVESLATAIEFRSEESGGHVRASTILPTILLSRTDWDVPGLRRMFPMIALAAIMHDVGKIAIPDSILNKPGRLDRGGV